LFSRNIAQAFSLGRRKSRAGRNFSRWKKNILVPENKYERALDKKNDA